MGALYLNHEYSEGESAFILGITSRQFGIIVLPYITTVPSPTSRQKVNVQGRAIAGFLSDTNHMHKLQVNSRRQAFKDGTIEALVSRWDDSKVLEINLPSLYFPEIDLEDNEKKEYSVLGVLAEMYSKRMSISRDKTLGALTEYLETLVHSPPDPKRIVSVFIYGNQVKYKERDVDRLKDKIFAQINRTGEGDGRYITFDNFCELVYSGGVDRKKVDGKSIYNSLRSHRGEIILKDDCGNIVPVTIRRGKGARYHADAANMLAQIIIQGNQGNKNLKKSPFSRN